MKNSKNVYIEAYGCSANVSDSELIAGMLSNDGYNIVDHHLYIQLGVVLFVLYHPTTL